MLTVLPALVLISFGLFLLRASWLSNRRPHLPWAICGWLSLGASFVILAREMGGELALAYGLTALAVMAYAAVAMTVEVRERRSQASTSLALEPEARGTNWRRAIVKSLLAIVLAGVAAIGVGVAFAVAMPLAVHDRIVIGGVLVPVLWGGGMAWTLADAKLIRATIILLSVSVVSYGVAFLPKVLMR